MKIPSSVLAQAGIAFVGESIGPHFAESGAGDGPIGMANQDFLWCECPSCYRECERRLGARAGQGTTSEEVEIVLDTHFSPFVVKT
jgi:hypothetical protein